MRLIAFIVFQPSLYGAEDLLTVIQFKNDNLVESLKFTSFVILAKLVLDLIGEPESSIFNRL